MSIASKLTKLQTDISNAYTSIATQGGTVPQNKNTENLSSAILSISGGGSGVTLNVSNNANISVSGTALVITDS